MSGEKAGSSDSEASQVGGAMFWVSLVCCASVLFSLVLYAQYPNEFSLHLVLGSFGALSGLVVGSVVGVLSPHRASE